MKNIFALLRKKHSITPAAATTPPPWPHASSTPILHAFSLHGTHYYHHPNPLEMPCERALYALSYYEELNMRCTREHLLGHVQATRQALNTQNWTRAAELNAVLQDRLEWAWAPDLVYKLASALYFDAAENPAGYSPGYARQKIDRWKASGEAAFFLQLPLGGLLPSVPVSGPDFQPYLRAVRHQTLRQLLHLLDTIPEASKTGEPWDTLHSQAADLQAWLRHAS